MKVHGMATPTFRQMQVTSNMAKDRTEEVMAQVMAMAGAMVTAGALGTTVAMGTVAVG